MPTLNPTWLARNPIVRDELQRVRRAGAVRVLACLGLGLVAGAVVFWVGERGRR